MYYVLLGKVYAFLAFATVLCLINVVYAAWGQADTSEAVPRYKLMVDGNEFEIPWYMMMKTGKISSIEVDEQTTSVIIKLERSEEAADTLVITLPRKLIDAGEDVAEFTVKVDDIEVNYDEAGPTVKERQLDIPLSDNATKVQIFGTYIIPEFPVNLTSILAIGFITILVSIRFRGMQFP